MCNKCGHKYYSIYCVARDNMNLHSREIQRPNHLSGVILLRKCVQTQLCLTLQPHELQPTSLLCPQRILEWVAISYCRGFSWPRDWIHISFISCTGKWILYHLGRIKPPGKPKESTCQCRKHGFDPWSRKILHAMEQLSQCATTIEPIPLMPWNWPVWMLVESLPIT